MKNKDEMATEQEMINRKRKFSESQEEEEDLDDDLQLTLSLSFPPTTPTPPPPPLQEEEDHHNDLQLTLSLSFPPSTPPPPPPPEKQPPPPLQEDEDHHNDLQLTLSLSFAPTGTPPPPPPPQEEEGHHSDKLTLSLSFPPTTPPPPPPLPTLSLPPPPLQQPPLSLSLIPPRLQQKPIPPSLTPSPPPTARLQVLQQPKAHQPPPSPPPSSPLPPPTHLLCKPPLAPMRVSSCAIRNPQQKKSETIRAPFAWATTRRATVQSLDVLVSKEIFTITGDVQCKQCNSRYEIQYDLIEKFYELGNFIVKNKNTMLDRAPNKWLNPVLPKCKFCQELDNGVVEPVIAKKKRGINWLFLLLGRMIGCCTQSQLKYFCRHAKNHRTVRTMDRLVYITYLGLFKQLDPNGPF